MIIEILVFSGETKKGLKRGHEGKRDKRREQTKPNQQFRTANWVNRELIWADVLYEYPYVCLYEEKTMKKEMKKQGLKTGRKSSTDLPHCQNNKIFFKVFKFAL